MYYRIKETLGVDGIFRYMPQRSMSKDGSYADISKVSCTSIKIARNIVKSFEFEPIYHEV